MTSQEAVQRMLNMMLRPKMYAVSKEGYFVQHWLLMEVAGLSANEIREFMISLIGNDASCGLEQLDDAFLDFFNTALLNFLEKKGLT